MRRPFCILLFQIVIMGRSGGKLECICHPEHPIIGIWNTRIQNGRHIGKKVYWKMKLLFWLDSSLIIPFDVNFALQLNTQTVKMTSKRRSFILLIFVIKTLHWFRNINQLKSVPIWWLNIRYCLKWIHIAIQQQLLISSEIKLFCSFCFAAFSRNGA